MNNSLKQKELENQAIIKTKEIHRGKVFTLVRESLLFNKHPPCEWDIITHLGAVAILPITDAGNLLLIQQWRRPVRKIIYEIPAGVFNGSETPEKAAQREAQEEVGYRAGELIPLGGLYTAPGYCTEYIHLFIAKNLKPSTLPKDPHEAIDVCEVSFDEALALIDQGEIVDAKTICALLKYQRWEKNNAQI